jgi:nucleoid DNA-binding protein
MATKKAAKKSPKKAKKAPAGKKVAAKKAPAKKKASGPISEKMTKGQIVANLADSSGLTKKQVSSVLEAYDSLVERSISKRGVGEFTLPGILKISTVSKPATKARPGISPFTKEPIMIKAKPARRIVKVRALKKLKEFAAS